MTKQRCPHSREAKEKDKESRDIAWSQRKSECRTLTADIAAGKDGPEKKNMGKKSEVWRTWVVRPTRKEVGPKSVLTRRAVSKGNLVCTPSTASATRDNLTVMMNSHMSRNTGETLIANAPGGDSRANGRAERAVQTLEKQVRVKKLGQGLPLH